VSILSSIAEGDKRETDKEAVRYFIVKGSSAEVLTQAIIAFKIGCIQKEINEEIEQICYIIEINNSMLKNLSSLTLCL
jgi:four helix bundle protein